MAVHVIFVGTTPGKAKRGSVSCKRSRTPDNALKMPVENEGKSRSW
jgi:hypothetical protein